MFSFQIRPLIQDPSLRIPVQATWDIPEVSDGYAAYRCLTPWQIQGEIFYVGMDEMGEDVIEFSGTVSTELRMSCDRCLRQVDVPLVVDIRQRFVKGDKTDSRTEDYDFDYLPIENDMIDLEDVIRYDVQLNIPVKVLCREDCLGLCPICGKNLNEGLCECEEDFSDPRWDALKNLPGLEV